MFIYNKYKNNNFRLTVFILIIFLWASNCHSQNVDSLVKVISLSSKSDSVKIISVKNLMEETYSAGKYENSILLAKFGLQLSYKNEDQITQGYFLHYIGRSYFKLSEFNKAVDFYNQAYELRERINDSLGMAKTLGNLGNTYYELSIYNKALESELKCLKISQRIQADQVISNVLNSLGQLYEKTEDYEKSLEYYLKSYEYETKQNNTEGIGKSLGNIASIYKTKGEKTKNKSDLNKAFQFQIKANRIAKEVNDLGTLSNGYNLLGSINELEGNYERALSDFFEMKDICEKSDDKIGVLISKLSIARLYTKTNRINESEQLLLECLNLSVKYEVPDYEMTSYLYLSEVYDAQRKIPKAYENFKNYYKLKNNILNDENQRQMVRHEMNFAFEKRESFLKGEEEKRILTAAAESRRQKIILYSVSLVLLLVVILVFMIYKNLRSNKIKNKIIEDKHKEITDSINYAERIQRSFLATKELLDNNLNEYFILFKPKDIVSGDFYWGSELSNGNFAFVTADSTGHGVPGAIMSLLNITSLEKAVEESSNPSEILNKTRKTIIERLKKDGSLDGGKDGMDCSIMSFNQDKSKLELASAHNPVWIMSGNEVIEIKADKMPVGKHDRDQISFITQSFDLQIGDVIYALTDGFPDQFGGERCKKFMAKKLRELLQSISQKPMQEQKTILEQIFSDWIGDLEQIDDVTLIGIRV